MPVQLSALLKKARISRKDSEGSDGSGKSTRPLIGTKSPTFRRLFTRGAKPEEPEARVDATNRTGKLKAVSYDSVTERETPSNLKQSANHNSHTQTSTAQEPVDNRVGASGTLARLKRPGHGSQTKEPVKP